MFSLLTRHHRPLKFTASSRWQLKSATQQRRHERQQQNDRARRVERITLQQQTQPQVDLVI